MCLAPELTSRSDQPVGASDYPQWSFCTNLLTPKDGGRFTLESLTNRSHQVDLRSPHSPCLISCVQDETGWWLLNVHKSYNPISSLRIMFWYWGRLRQLSNLKNLRFCTDPGGVCCKRIILQGRQMHSGLPIICQSCLRRKEDVIGASVNSTIQSNSQYLHTGRGYIYNTRWPKHPN